MNLAEADFCMVDCCAQSIHARIRVQTAVSNDWDIAISISQEHAAAARRHFNTGEAFATVPKIRPSLLPYSFLVVPTAVPTASCYHHQLLRYSSTYCMYNSERVGQSFFVIHLMSTTNQ